MVHFHRSGLALTNLGVYAIALTLALVGCGGKKSHKGGGSAGTGAILSQDGTGGASDDTRNSNTTSQASEQAFETSLFPLLNKNCKSCHAPGGNPETKPFLAQDDSLAAFQAIMDAQKVDLTNPENSRIYLKLFDDNHNCWSDCKANAAELLAAINTWADNATVSDGELATLTTDEHKVSDFKMEVPANPTPGTIVLEAEKGTITGVIAPQAMDLASRGSALGLVNDKMNPTFATAAASTDTVKYTFNITVAGNYFLVARANAETTADDQGFASIDNPTTFQNWIFPTTPAGGAPGQFTWVALNNGVLTTPNAATALTAGAHTVEIRRREDGLFLDMIALTNDPQFPGVPGSATDAKISTIQPSPTADDTRAIMEFDMSKVCNSPGAKLTIEAAVETDQSYKLRNPKLVVQSGTVHIENLSPIVNGKANTNYVTYKLVDADIAAGAADGGLLSTGSQVVLQENGVDSDTISFRVGACTAK